FCAARTHWWKQASPLLPWYHAWMRFAVACAGLKNSIMRYTLYHTITSYLASSDSVSGAWLVFRLKVSTLMPLSAMIWAIQRKVVGVVLLWSDPQFPFIRENFAVVMREVIGPFWASASAAPPARTSAASAKTL